MEQRRSCGFLEEKSQKGERVIWGNGPVVTYECPTSAIAGQSLSWLEMWAAVRRWPAAAAGAAARDLDAMTVLENEWERMRDEQRGK